MASELSFHFSSTFSSSSSARKCYIHMYALDLEIVCKKKQFSTRIVLVWAETQPIVSKKWERIEENICVKMIAAHFHLPNQAHLCFYVQFSLLFCIFFHSFHCDDLSHSFTLYGLLSLHFFFSKQFLTSFFLFLSVASFIGFSAYYLRFTHKLLTYKCAHTHPLHSMQYSKYSTHIVHVIALIVHDLNKANKNQLKKCWDAHKYMQFWSICWMFMNLGEEMPSIWTYTPEAIHHTVTKNNKSKIET